MNLLIDLRGYEGNNANTSRSLFNKNLQQIGINIDREITQEVEVPANSGRYLFSATNIEGVAPPVGSIFASKSFNLTTQQDLVYIEICKIILVDSLILANGRLLGHRNDDYEISFIDGKTRITWTNTWAQGGDLALELDEKISLWYSYNPLQQENSEQSAENAQAEEVSLYRFVYMEVDKECDVIINGTIKNTVKPILINNIAKKGVFLMSSEINNVYIVNNNSTNLIVYFITAK